jgi:hypothetical protein
MKEFPKVNAEVDESIIINRIIRITILSRDLVEYTSFASFR